MKELSKDLGGIFGMMDKVILVIGRIIIKMEWGFRFQVRGLRLLGCGKMADMLMSLSELIKYNIFRKPIFIIFYILTIFH